MRLFLFLSLTLLWSCGGQNASSATNDSTTTPAPDLDLTQYQIEAFNNGISIATKLDEQKRVIERGVLKNGKRNGSWTEYYVSGNPKVVTSYVDGQRNGMIIEYDKNARTTKIANFVNNEFNGRYREFVSYIPVRDSYFKNGKFHGLHKEYNEQGKLFKDVMFDNGVQNGPMNFYNDGGVITASFMYKDGEKVDGGIVK